MNTDERRYLKAEKNVFICVYLRSSVDNCFCVFRHITSGRIQNTATISKFLFNFLHVMVFFIYNTPSLLVHFGLHLLFTQKS